MKKIENLRKALSDLVKINEDHNASIEAIIGRPLGWKDDYLNNARQALKETDNINIDSISDEDIRDLLSKKDVGSARQKLKRILEAL